MQNSMVMFTFLVFDPKYLFWKIWSKKSKLSVEGKTWYLNYFEYAEFNGHVHFFVFGRKYPFWANLVQKIKVVKLRET